MKVDTAQSGVYATCDALEIGTFTIEKGEPTRDLYAMEDIEAVYTGEKQEPTITPVGHAGDVKAVHYFTEGSDEAMDTAPVTPGRYTVKIDTAESATCAPTEGFELGTFTIEKARPTKALYTLEDNEAVCTGEKQHAAITQADNAGAVKAVRYYAEGTGQLLDSEPVEAGVYTVRIDTAENGIYEAADSLQIGTLTIK